MDNFGIILIFLLFYFYTCIKEKEKERKRRSTIDNGDSEFSMVKLLQVKRTTRRKRHGKKRGED